MRYGKEVMTRGGVVGWKERRPGKKLVNRAQKYSSDRSSEKKAVERLDQLQVLICHVVIFPSTKYSVTPSISDFDCILTTVSLERIDRTTLRLKADEELRVNNILKRAMDLERGVLTSKPTVAADHPDGCK